MFADTDLLLALLKDSDWLKENALKVLSKHKGKIRTSMSVMLELAFIGKRLKMPVVELFVNVLELVSLDEASYEVCLRAALYLDQYGLTVFDAFHAACCLGDTMVSSDAAYDKVGFKRLRLEKRA